MTICQIFLFCLALSRSVFSKQIKKWRYCRFIWPVGKSTSMREMTGCFNVGTEDQRQPKYFRYEILKDFCTKCERTFYMKVYFILFFSLLVEQVVWIRYEAIIHIELNRWAARNLCVLFFYCSCCCYRCWMKWLYIFELLWRNKRIC